MCAVFKVVYYLLKFRAIHAQGLKLKIEYWVRDTVKCFFKINKHDTLYISIIERNFPPLRQVCQQPFSRFFFDKSPMIFITKATFIGKAIDIPDTVASNILLGMLRLAFEAVYSCFYL